MPDIRIVPDSSSMSFTSSMNFIQTLRQDPSGGIVVQGSGSVGRTELFSVLGSNGQLFSVTDELSGSIYSVNTIAGLPVIEAFSDNSVTIGAYGRQSLIITGSTGNLQLSGSIRLVSIPTSSITNVLVFNTSSREISYNQSFTASYATQALSSSYSITASYALTSSFATQALSSSFATTSSFATQALSSSYSITASYALNGGGGSVSDFPYTGSAIISGSLGITGSLQIQNTLFQYAENTDIDTGTENILVLSTGSYRAAFFDYVATSGNNARAGTVMSVWTGASIQYTEASTEDIGTTTPLNLEVVLSGSNVVFRARTTSDNWIVESLARFI